MRRLLWTLPAAFFFLNPGFACGPAEPQYEYDEADMRAAVEGTWSFSILPQGASAPLPLTVKVEEAATAPASQTTAARPRALVRAAYACGARTFVKSASACTDSSTMPLAVTFLSGDGSFASAPLSGTFTVLGTGFVPAITALEFVLGAYHVHAQLTPTGVPLMATVMSADGATAGLPVVAHN